MTFEKLYRDDRLGVVYSPGFGAGWSTWACSHIADQIATDRRIVEAVLAEDRQAANRLASEIADANDAHAYLGCSRLEVAWVPRGALYRVDEYDGSEAVQQMEDLGMRVA